MLSLGFLGTGGAVPSVDRDNSSLLLNKDEELILVDCPGSPIQKIKKLHLDPSGIKKILITHIHPDHVYGLPSLIHGLMDRAVQISLYGSEETHLFCQELLHHFHLIGRPTGARVEFIPLKPGETFSLGQEVECTTFDVLHHPSSLGFRFDLPGENLVLIYSGDTAVHLPLFRSAKDADCLIHDCSAPSRFFQTFPQLKTMHTSARELGRLAEESGVKCLIPVHFFGEMDFSFSEIETEIKECFSGKLIIPEDLETMEFSNDRKGRKK